MGGASTGPATQEQALQGRPFQHRYPGTLPSGALATATLTPQPAAQTPAADTPARCLSPAPRQITENARQKPPRPVTSWRDTLNADSEGAARLDRLAAMARGASRCQRQPCHRAGPHRGRARTLPHRQTLALEGVAHQQQRHGGAPHMSGQLHAAGDKGYRHCRQFRQQQPYRLRHAGFQYP